MKAIQIFKHSKTDLTTSIVDIKPPTLAPDEVLVEVKAAGVNPLDNMITRGDVKLIVPYSFPLTMGNELSGVVVAVGTKVKGFAIGDRVFARMPTNRPGAFAENVSVPAAALAHMPSGLSFVEGASIPLTALTAFQALELMNPRAGESIFISGGSGGLGAMAIPLAKARGLIVYTNGNAESRERVRSLGADRYLDYRTEDYLETLGQVDYVLDSLGGKELTRQMQLLRSGGKIVSLRGLPNGRFARSFGLPKWKQWLLSLVGSSLDRQAKRQGATYDFLFVEANGTQLATVAHLIETLGIRPSVDKVYPFDQVNEALAQVARGGSSGKTVLTLE